MVDSEIHFVVEEAPESGYIAMAVSENIFTDAEDIPGLHARVRDAMRCHFDDGAAPIAVFQGCACLD